MEADAYLSQNGLIQNPCTKADGSPFSIAYVDIDPYPLTGEMLYRFVEELNQKGWIHLSEELPFDPADTDARALIEYLDGQDLGEYLSFSADACYYLAVDGEDTCKEKLQKQVEAGDIDLIFCMGTWPGKMVREMGITSVPIMVYTSVDPVGSGIVESTEKSGQENLWAHINYTIYNRQLAFFHQTIPFSNMGFIYYDESIAAMRAYREVAKKEGFTLTEKGIEQLDSQNEDAKKEYYQQLMTLSKELITQNHVDAMMLSTDIVKDEKYLQDFLQQFYDAGIPVFVQNGEYFVEEGALMTLTASDASQQAPFIVSTMAQILHGAKPEALQQEYITPPYLSINLEAAEEIGYKPDINLLLSAEKIYSGGEGQP